MIPEKFPKFNALFGIDDVAAGLIIGGVGGSLISTFGGSAGQRSSDARNASLQREFAKNRVQWTTADARAAGIHPLAALGASPISAQPSYIGSGRHWEKMGQNISRMATNLALQKQKAEIAKLGAETTMLRSATVPSSPPAGAVYPPTMMGASPKAIDPKPQASYKFIDLPDGSRAAVLKEQGGGVDEDPFAFAQKFGKRFRDYLGGLPTPWSLIPYFRRKQEQMRNWYKPVDPPKEGYEWKYEPVFGTFIETPLKKPYMSGRALKHWKRHKEVIRHWSKKRNNLHRMDGLR